MLEAFDPELLGLLAVTGGVCAAMVRLATRLNMLEQRQPPRCPACGVIRYRGVCSCDR
jgi:hypothetical protein